MLGPTMIALYRAPPESTNQSRGTRKLWVLSPKRLLAGTPSQMNGNGGTEATGRRFDTSKCTQP
jgi:hypothetical protein